MMKLVPFLLLNLALASGLLAGPIVNIDQLGQRLGGWNEKGDRAAEYESSGSKYRTWKPEVTAMLDGGIFISLRIDHLRGVFASDDHAILQVTLDRHGNITEASSSMALQGKRITSDAIRLGTTAGSSMVAIDKIAKVGTDLVADLSAKLLQENIAEPGRVSFPAVISHNYNLLCLATGIIKENQLPRNAAVDTGAEEREQRDEDFKNQKRLQQNSKAPADEKRQMVAPSKSS
ncbi:MAG: hypothetical protein Q7Q71_10895 [Verrucomicrobiota bacterium JB023]|nr:hypothetical protein [Verrucomicrobiota bacterium JB023]